jgi:hypothetical protein
MRIGQLEGSSAATLRRRKTDLIEPEPPQSGTRALVVVDYAVDQQERIAMRQNPHNVVNVELGVLSRSRFGRSVQSVGHSR